MNEILARKQSTRFCEHVLQEQANRLSSVPEPTREQLLTIEACDIEGALAAVLPAASTEQITGVTDEG
jgi:hypothetical protein